jgi:ADP-ribose pyrophosphatase
MDDALSDHPADVLIEGPHLLGRGFYRYEQYQVARAGDDAHSRDVVRVGRVVVILAVDLARDEIVLIREFRLGAHLATGKGDVVEVPAGRVEGDEPLAEAARRECLEETGVAPGKLVPLFSVMPSPGMSDEHQFFFLALVDASKVPEQAGATHEHEETRPMRVCIDDALGALERGHIHYGAAIFALQWLALNRGRLAEIARRGDAR